MADTDAFFTPPPTTRLHARRAARRRRAAADVSERARHAASGEQHGVRARCFPPRDGTAGARRAAVLVLPQWNSDAGGHVGLCRLLAMNGMTALRLSLPYHDRRMPPELHRADYIVSANVARTRAGVPAGGARRAARDRVARRAGLRAHRHSRHEPRLVPLAADDGARAADPGAGAQSHLAVLRRRRLARPLDARTCARDSTATSSSICCASCGSRSARAGISSACAIGRRCSSTRSTT